MARILSPCLFFCRGRTQNNPNARVSATLANASRFLFICSLRGTAPFAADISFVCRTENTEGFRLAFGTTLNSGVARMSFISDGLQSGTIATRTDRNLDFDTVEVGSSSLLVPTISSARHEDPARFSAVFNSAIARIKMATAIKLPPNFGSELST